MNNLRLGHVNIRSLYPSFNEFKDILNNEKFSILGITETWLTPLISSTVLGVDGYKLIRNDRTGRGGGVAIYYDTRLNINIFNCENFPELEQIWITVKIKQINYGIGIVYRPPSQNLNQSLKILENSLSDILPLVDNLIVLGDLNINMLNLNCNATVQLLELLGTYNLSQLINEPTRINNISSTLIDVILTNNTTLISDSGCLDLHDLTDHRLVFCNLNVKIANNGPTLLNFRDFKMFNYELFLGDLQLINWDLIYSFPDVNDKLHFLTSNILNLFNLHAPIRTIKVSKPRAPWLTDVIKIMIKTRDKLLSKYHKTRNPAHWADYKAMRNYVTSSIKREKIAYLEFCHKKGSQETWKALEALNITNKTKSNLPENLRHPEDINHNFIQVAANAPPICQELFRFFENNMFSDNPARFKFENITNSQVEKIIYNVKSNAKGADDISITMIKYCIPHLTDYITHILNSIIETNQFPQEWKKALIIPAPKISNPSSYSDLRPISILPTLSKILERILHDQMNAFLNANKLLPLQQSGFRQGYSTVTALLDVTDDIARGVDNKMTTALVLLDYSKAFDTVNHDLLCAKLKYYGFHSSAFNLIKNYLTNRSQSVIINNTVSSALPVTSGVPQGSIIGPLLFVLYTSDVCRQLNYSHCHQYADDTNIYLAFTRDNALQAQFKLNSDLSSIQNYSTRNSLILNPLKTVMIYFGNDYEWAATNLNVNLDGVRLPVVTSAKSLGLILDSKLRYREHVTKLLQKCYLALRNLYRNKTFLSTELKKKLTETLVLSITNYADIVYGPCLDVKTADRLQKVQNNCTRLIHNLTWRDHVSNKINEMGWLNMRYRRQLHLVCFIHKLLKTKCPSYLFTKLNFRYLLHNVNVRNQLLLNVPRHRTTFFRRSFSYCCSKFYNAVPNEFKSYSHQRFKTSMYKLFLSRQILNI